MTAPKIAPCPVCGRPPLAFGATRADYAAVECVDSMHTVRVIAFMKRDAIAKWNRTMRREESSR